MVEKAFKADLPEIFGGVNTSLLSTLLENFMEEPGGLLNFSSLSKDLRVHRLRWRDIFYLEFIKLIRVVRN